MVSADARREPPESATKMVVVRRLPILKRNLYKHHIDLFCLLFHFLPEHIPPIPFPVKGCKSKDFAQQTLVSYIGHPSPLLLNKYSVSKESTDSAR